jgi:hypothetical protein
MTLKAGGIGPNSRRQESTPRRGVFVTAVILLACLSSTSATQAITIDFEDPFLVGLTANNHLQGASINSTAVVGNAYRILSTLEKAADADYDGRGIEVGDCCDHCARSNRKRTRRQPSKLPPFHVGCTCSLEGAYD